MIEKYYLFSTLTEAERESVEKRLFLKPFETDTVIYEESDPADALYFIQKGSVEIFRNIREKPLQSIMTLGQGDFFGEVGVIDGGSRFAGAKAVEDLELFVLLRSDFDRIINDNKDIRHKIYTSFITEMAGRLRKSDDAFRRFFRSALAGET